MANHRASIALIGTNLGEGDTIREVCPRCGGGSTGEKSLSLSRREGHLVWQCFRAKCEFRGATGGAGIPTKAREPAAKRRRVWEGTTHPVPDDVARRIMDMWHMEVPENWWWTTDYGGRVAMSVRSPKFTHRGWVLRSITPTEGAKALTYINEGEQGMSWYKTSPHRGTVLVEDIPSAVRASKYVNSCALLGTGIGMDRAIEIAENAPRPLYVTFDQDATALAFRWARRYALLWGDVQVLPLEHDLKDLPENELEEKLTRV